MKSSARACQIRTARGDVMSTWPTIAAIAVSLGLHWLMLLPASASVVPVIVENPAAPTGGRVVVQPTELWRVGGEGEAEGELFGVVQQAVVDADGNSYLLDEQLHDVRVFDAEGGYVTSFGREGEGPGELDHPQDLVLFEDGRIGVLHGRPSRLTLFAPSGGMGEDLRIGDGEAFGFSRRAEMAGARPVVQRSLTTMGDGTSTSTQLLVGLDPATGAHAIAYVEKSETQEQLASSGRVMISISTTFIEDWTAGPDGRVYVVREGDSYEIEVYGPDGTHERTIRRAYDRVAKPTDVYENDRAQMRSFAERFGSAFDESTVNKHYSDIDRLHVRPGGELWVLPSSGRMDDDPGALGVFDVFDASGRLVRQVEVRVPFDRGEDRFSFEGSDLFVFENAIDAARSGGGFIVFSDSDRADDEAEEEIEPLSIVRYSMP